MPGANTDIAVVGAFNPVEGHIVSVPTHQEIDEKLRISADNREISKDTLDFDTKELSDVDKDDNSDDNVIIITGADAAAHLLPLRDDGEPALSFRSIVLATVLSGFQAVMYQIYSVSDDWYPLGYQMNLTSVSSSNQPPWVLSKVPSSFSLPTFSARHGQTSFPAVTNLKLDGGRRVDKVHHHSGYELYPSSTMDRGISKNTLFVPSQPHQPPTRPRPLPYLQLRICSMAYLSAPLPSSWQ